MATPCELAISQWLFAVTRCAVPSCPTNWLESRITRVESASRASDLDAQTHMRWIVSTCCSTLFYTVRTVSPRAHQYRAVAPRNVPTARVQTRRQTVANARPPRTARLAIAAAARTTQHSCTVHARHDCKWSPSRRLFGQQLYSGPEFWVGTCSFLDPCEIFFGLPLLPFVDYPRIRPLDMSNSAFK